MKLVLSWSQLLNYPEAILNWMAGPSFALIEVTLQNQLIVTVAFSKTFSWRVLKSAI